MFNKFIRENAKILDFGCGSNFDELKNRYHECSHVTLVDKIGNEFIENNFKLYKN